MHKGVFRTGNGAYDQVYTLEKVLKIKKDPITQTEFLDDVMKVRSCQDPGDTSQLICSDWTKSQASHSGRLWRMRSKPRPRRLLVVSHYLDILAILVANHQHLIGYSKHSVLATLAY